MYYNHTNLLTLQEYLVTRKSNQLSKDEATAFGITLKGKWVKRNKDNVISYDMLVRASLLVNTNHYYKNTLVIDNLKRLVHKYSNL